jgi:hypothetical protein
MFLHYEKHKEVFPASQLGKSLMLQTQLESARVDEN